MHTQPRPEPPVPIAPIHRRSWRTLWRRCSCGLSEPCVDRLTTARPAPDTLSDAASAHHRAADVPLGATDPASLNAGATEDPTPDTSAPHPQRGKPEPRGRLYVTPVPRQRPPEAQPGGMGDGRGGGPMWRDPAADPHGSAAERPGLVAAVAPPIRFFTSVKGPAFPRRADSDLTRPLGPAGAQLELSRRTAGPTGRPLRTRDAELGRAGLLTPGQASRCGQEMAGKVRRAVPPLPRPNGTAR